MLGLVCGGSWYADCRGKLRTIGVAAGFALEARWSEHEGRQIGESECGAVL